MKDGGWTHAMMKRMFGRPGILPTVLCSSTLIAIG